MMDSKAINTLMVTNLKLLNGDSLETVDVTLYKHIIASLMYLTKTKPNICFSMNTLSKYMVDPRHVHQVAADSEIRLH